MLTREPLILIVELGLGKFARLKFVLHDNQEIDIEYKCQ